MLQFKRSDLMTLELKFWLLCDFWQRVVHLIFWRRAGELVRKHAEHFVSISAHGWLKYFDWHTWIRSARLHWKHWLCMHSLGEMLCWSSFKLQAGKGRLSNASIWGCCVSYAKHTVNFTCIFWGWQWQDYCTLWSCHSCNTNRQIVTDGMVSMEQWWGVH